MNIILTSKVGIGKTNICEKLVKLIKKNKRKNIGVAGIICKSDTTKNNK
ncbi:MAG: nucleoside-triphosphatase [Candidatus Woesearchaeota archaeon]